MLGIDFAGGAAIFAIFLVVYLLAVVYSLYTRAGSGINHHPYLHVHGSAPGARHGRAVRSDVASWSRGTR